jgi:hypothetical protein
LLLAAISYNFRLLIAWITRLCAFIQNLSSSDTKIKLA